MKREKILIILLAVWLMLSLTACGVEAAEQEIAPVAVCRNVEASEGRMALYDALDTALNGSGLIYRKYDAATQTDQGTQIDGVIEQGCSLLIVDLIDAAAAPNVIEKARAAGIGVVFMGCDVPAETLAGYEKACCVAIDSEDLQTAQGRMIGTYLLDHFEEADLNGDGTITYVLLGEEDAPVHKAEQVLADGSLAVLRPYEAAREDTMEDVLRNCSVENNNMVECVIALSDDTALEAAWALQKAGYNGPGQIRICVFGIGGTAQALQAVAEGALTGTVYDDTAGAARTICSIAVSLTGEGKLPGEQWSRNSHGVCIWS